MNFTVVDVTTDYESHFRLPSHSRWQNNHLQQEKVMIDENALKSIEKLHEMKSAGVLSEEEFIAAKQKLLSGNQRVSSLPAAARPTAETPEGNDYLGWALLPLRRYAQFTGRSSRKEFWLFLLGVNVVNAVLALVWLGDTNFLGYTGAIGNLASMLLALGILAAIVPYLAVQVRRFHDQGRSGWFALLNLIPYIGAVIAMAFMLIDGVPDENQYGPDPKA